MSDQTKILIDLLNEGRTCNEICNILKISNKQLYNNLTNLQKKGIMFLRKYFETGDIVYKLVNSYDLINNGIENEIIASSSKVIRCLVLSDLHFGNKLERLDIINEAFNYCINNNIHIILCCGDLIDGTFTQGEQTIDNGHYQIDYFIKEYPHDRNILTFGVGGDHDISVLNNNCHDLLEAIRNYRHDIIVPSYNNAIVKIKNIKILLHHYLSKDIMIDNCNINLFGHSHKYTVSCGNNQINVRVPSVSDINVQSYNVLPSFFETDLYFSNDDLEMIKFIQLYFNNNKLYILNELNYEISNTFDDTKKIKSLDQVSRFYQRYNK